jgi:hypothetical protein
MLSLIHDETAMFLHSRHAGGYRWSSRGDTAHVVTTRDVRTQPAARACALAAGCRPHAHVQ